MQFGVWEPEGDGALPKTRQAGAAERARGKPSDMPQIKYANYSHGSLERCHGCPYVGCRLTLEPSGSISRELTGLPA